jgi:hypothetical protein
MTKTTVKKTKQPVACEQLTDDEFHAGMVAYWKKFDRMPKAKQRALFIEWDILNPDGTLRRYPMNHVPLGPRG